MTRIVLGTSGGRDIPLDLDRLVETRMLVQANSGGGKSWALRRILEQTHGQVQQLVIDVEDEFHTLRERYDYVLAGRHGGDCPADVRSAALLARRLLELRTSAILGIYELRAHDRIRFVRLFLEALVNAPKDLWHPAIVVVDEAHLFCPQVGQAESAGAVIDLMTRGRKRGFCGVLATQRISKLHKDAAAEANNKLIGRSALDVDMKRAADELGLAGREEQARLRSLRPGHFFAFGPAVSEAVVEIVVSSVSTTHPRAGERAAPPPPPRAAVQRVLAELADLPAEAEQEAQDLETGRRRIRDLERELVAARAGKPDPGAVEAAVAAARSDAGALADRRAAELVRRVRARDSRAAAAFTAVADALGRVVDLAQRANAVLSEPIDVEIPALPSPGPGPVDSPALCRSTPTTAGTPAPSRGSPVRASREPQEGITGPMQRILDALAWLESIGVEEPEQTATAFLASYTIGGGAWNNPRSALRTAGLIEYLPGDRLRLTDTGRGAAAHPDAPLTTAELHSRVLDRLPGPERKLLTVLLEDYPDAIANDELARRAGYEPGGGAFNNPRSRLRTLGLADYPERGKVRARALLFLERA